MNTFFVPGLFFLSVAVALMQSDTLKSFKKSSMLYVDDAIAGMLLRSPSDEASHFLVGSRISFPDSASMDDLINFAHECDRALFEDATTANDASNEDFGEALQKFVGKHKGKSHASLIATLLALNSLESAIRDATGYSTGHAPLLKTMICELPESRVYKLLLTPAGLNLRNLVWHGFLAALPRCWFSLVLTLTRVLRVSRESNTHDLTCRLGSCNMTQANMGQFFPSANLYVNPSSLHRDEDLSIWLPSSHYSLFQEYVQPWIEGQQYPATCCALLSILLEHGLRLRWCCANWRPLDTVACPGRLYVTLDGHGQRRIHDLLLHPYLLDGSENRLITDNTASTIALLTDLFCSSSGGQNIRARVSHGSWDEWLEEEWSHVKSTSEEHTLWRTVDLLVLAMQALAADKPIAYQPQFSYTPVMRNLLFLCQSNLKKLLQFSSYNSEYGKHSQAAQLLLGDIVPSTIPSGLLALQDRLDLLCVDNPLLLTLPTEWNSDTLFAEHTLNQKLEGLGLVRNLLEHVAAASHQLIQDLDRSLLEYPALSTRKKKSALRFVYVSRCMGCHLYTMAYNLAVFSLNDIDKDQYDQELDLKKALERTCMVVSTTQTMLRFNVDRARQSIVEYSKSKVVGQVFRVITGHLNNG